MQFVIVTGMSGAGKSTVLKMLEDFGFFCVDNLPPSLITKFIEVCSKTGSEIDNVALGIDIRGGKLFEGFFEGLSEISPDNDFTILFLDAADDVLIKRYKETRRSHPLAKSDRVSTGIELERELLVNIKSRANIIVDTSYSSTRQLRERIADIFVDKKKYNSLIITVLSFGYKYGIPEDSDLVFDVRFIPNPFYVPELKELSGNDSPVKDFVYKSDAGKVFLSKLIDMITFLIPHYISEGKTQLVISIGCTGGRHRSVALANDLCSAIHDLGYFATISHRDIDKDSKH